LKLFGSHQSISNFLRFLLIQIAVGHINFLYILEIREDTADSLSVLKWDDLIIHFQNSQFREALEAGVQVLITVASKNIVNLEFTKWALAVWEIFETLLEILKTVNTQVNEGVLVHFEYLKGGHSSNKGHKVIVIGLKLPLIQNFESQGVNKGAHNIYILIEKLEVLVLREVLEHLLKAQLEEEVSPWESHRVILNNSGIWEVSHHVASVRIGDFTSETVTFVLNLVKVLLKNLFVIIHNGKVSWSRFSSNRSIGLQLLNPSEFLHDGELPFVRLSWKPLFLFFRVELEGVYLFDKESLGLFINKRQLVHVVIISMITLFARVFDGSFQTSIKCLIIGNRHSKLRIVLVESFHILDGKALLLEKIFRLSVNAAEVRIKLAAELIHVFLSIVCSLDNHLVEVEEEEGDMETTDACLKANLCAGLFNYNVLILVFLIGMVKLRDFLKDPESLTI
jgi:hypothetical protein